MSVSSPRARGVLFGAFLASFLCLAAGPASAQIAVDFEDVTVAAGLNVSLQHVPDPPPLMMSGGGTIGDFNRDGWPDVFIPSGGIYPNRLFINQKDGTFADAAAAWGIAHLYRGVGSIAGDYDNDGDQDIYVTSMGNVPGAPTYGQNRLYRNEGGSFSEVAAAAGVNSTTSTTQIPDGFSAAFGDYDRDGDLDLFVAGWMLYSEGNRLFRNNGNGTFSDVTVAAGVFDAVVQGFSPRFTDLDGDRYPELLLAADFGTTRLYKNAHGGTFTNITHTMGPDFVHHGMGNTTGDIDGDLRLDWYVTSVFFDNPPAYANGNRLYLNRGLSGLIAAPFSSGVNNGGFGWGTVAADADHDGWVDIIENNGWPDPEWTNENCYFFHNNGDGTTTDLAVACNMIQTGQGKGLVHFDYDRDGDMDFLFFNNAGTPVLFRSNVTGANTHWLRLAFDTSANPALAPDGLGTRVYATRTVGGLPVTSVAYLDGGANYLGSSEFTLHFGLGSATVVDMLRIEWADGFNTILYNVAADQILAVAAGKPLEQTPLVRGGSTINSVMGVEPGETVHFVYGFAEGSTQGIPKLGGMALDIAPPVYVLGRAQADAAGTAVLTVTLPSTLPYASLTTQAVVQRGGPNGGQSVKTNVVTQPVL